MNPIRQLEGFGQSVWLDYIDRKLLLSGGLDRRIVHDGLAGVTSNPTIFQKAIAGSNDYDDLIRSATPKETNERVLERLMVRDLRLACDKLRPVYDASGGADGFASIEVSPKLASDAAASVEEATRLWQALDRPNAMVKIPGTRACLPAIRGCLAHGININITLLFSVPRYREVLEAYLGALESRVARNEPIHRVASVASFFVSRVDATVDKALANVSPDRHHDAAERLRGKIAVANAKLAYEVFEHICSTDRWRALVAKGARPQRLLWASTTPKDPSYADVHYVEPLIGRDTVDTMTPATLDAYRDHGQPRDRISHERDLARHQLQTLTRLGIDLATITDQLEEEGIRAFVDSYGKALDAIADKRGTSKGTATSDSRTAK